MPFVGCTKVQFWYRRTRPAQVDRGGRRHRAKVSTPGVACCAPRIDACTMLLLAIPQENGKDFWRSLGTQAARTRHAGRGAAASGPIRHAQVARAARRKRAAL